MLGCPSVCVSIDSCNQMCAIEYGRKRICKGLVVFRGEVIGDR